MQALPAGGAMLSVMADVAQCERLTAELDVEVAAVNGPQSTVVSGDEGAIADLIQQLEQRSIKSKPLVSLPCVSFCANGADVRRLSSGGGVG